MNYLNIVVFRLKHRVTTVFSCNNYFTVVYLNKVEVYYRELFKPRQISDSFFRNVLKSKICVAIITYGKQSVLDKA